MTFPAFAAAMADPRLPMRSLKVYHFATQRLDFEGYRPIKLAACAAAIRCHRQDVGADLRKLQKLGYLTRGFRAWPGGPFTFRLVWSLPDDGTKTLTPPAA